MPFTNPVVSGMQLVRQAIRSLDFIEGLAGWRISQDGGTQFQTLSVVEEAATDSLVAETITLAGSDLGDRLDAIPFLKTYSAFPTVNTTVDTAAIAATETILYRWRFADFLANHYYMFVYGFRPTLTVATDTFRLRMKYTTDGTAPTTASSILDHAQVSFTGPNDHSRSFLYSPASSNWDLIRIAWTLQRDSGTGTCAFETTDVNYAPYMGLIDLGLQDNVDFAIPEQISKSSGGSDATQVSSYTKTYPATWSRSYDADGGTRNGDDTEDCYQGYYSTTHGRTRSLVGFDQAQIQSDLAGATVTSLKLTFKVKYRAWSDGLDVYVSVHDYTSKPATWSGARVDEAEASRQDCNQGGTYTVDLSAHGAAFKSGALTGIGFGPGPDDGHSNYGRMYGNGGTGTSSGQPYLTIKYTK